MKAEVQSPGRKPDLLHSLQVSGFIPHPFLRVWRHLSWGALGSHTGPHRVPRRHRRGRPSRMNRLQAHQESVQRRTE